MFWRVLNESSDWRPVTGGLFSSSHLPFSLFVCKESTKITDFCSLTVLCTFYHPFCIQHFHSSSSLISFPSSLRHMHTVALTHMCLSLWVIVIRVSFPSLLISVLLFLCPLLPQCMCVFLHVRLCVSMWVASLEEGLFFLAHPRVLHSYPRPLYLSTFSFHFVYLRKVIGGLLNSLLVSLSCFREFGCVGRPEDGPWSLRAAKDSCFVNSERH